MGLLNWVGGKVANKLMDEADKELSLLRAAMGTEMTLWVRFVEALTHIRNTVPELTLMWAGDEGDEAAQVTREIRRIREPRRNALAQALLQLAAKHNRTDPVASAAYKMLGTWMKLVDILEDPNGSPQMTFRANNLLALYEAELNKVIKRMKETM